MIGRGQQSLASFSCADNRESPSAASVSRSPRMSWSSGWSLSVGREVWAPDHPSAADTFSGQLPRSDELADAGLGYAKDLSRLSRPDQLRELLLHLSARRYHLCNRSERVEPRDR